MSSPPWVAPFRAALDKCPPPHRFAFANTTPEGLPLVRSAILRGFAEDGTIWFLADERSDAVPYLRVNGNAEVMIWLDEENARVRLAGRASVHGIKDEGLWANVRQNVWAQLPPDEKERFLGGPPGRELGPPPLDTGVPEKAPKNVVLISIAVTKVDWLTRGEPDSRTLFRKLGNVWIDEAVYP